MNDNEIDRLLSMTKRTAPRSGRRCLSCDNERVQSILVRYFERKDAGEEMPSLTWIHAQLIHPVISFGAVRNHVIRCMGRNPATGDKL